MNVEDYYPQGKRWWVRLHEKGGKQHEMPAHHLLETYIDAYVTAAGIGADKTICPLPDAGWPQTQAARSGADEPTGRAADDRAARACRPGSSRSSAATPSGRPASPSICSTADARNAQQMAAHECARRRSSTTAAMIRSHSIRSNGSFSEGCFHSNRSLEPS